MASMVLTECPAPAHNSLRAAYGRNQVPKCVCPSALLMLAVEKQKRRDRRIARLTDRTVTDIMKVNEADVPDMELARCATSTKGYLAHQRAIERPGNRVIVELAQNVCAGCPIQRLCAEWVLKAEIRPGSWGGVYGGLSIKDRVRTRALADHAA